MLFVATAEAGDDEMRQRIEAHRLSRPADWRTLEAPTNVGKRILAEADGVRVIILDCITLLVNNIIAAAGPVAQPDEALIDTVLNREMDNLLDAIAKVPAHFIMVTNEVGLGIVPDNPLARLYRDLLGKINQRLAGQAEEVYLMVAGIPLPIIPK